MSFDLNQFEAIHFSQNRKFDNVKIQLSSSLKAPYNAEPRIVKPPQKYLAIRWLRVYFNFCLFFKYEAEKIASKGWKTVLGLNILGNIVQGVKPYGRRQVVNAWILPLFNYKTPAW